MKDFIREIASKEKNDIFESSINEYIIMLNNFLVSNKKVKTINTGSAATAAEKGQNIVDDNNPKSLKKSANVIDRSDDNSEMKPIKIINQTIKDLNLKPPKRFDSHFNMNNNTKSLNKNNNLNISSGTKQENENLNNVDINNSNISLNPIMVHDEINKYYNKSLSENSSEPTPNSMRKKPKSLLNSNDSQGQSLGSVQHNISKQANEESKAEKGIEENISEKNIDPTQIGEENDEQQPFSKVENKEFFDIFQSESFMDIKKLSSKLNIFFEILEDNKIDKKLKKLLSFIYPKDEKKNFVVCCKHKNVSLIKETLKKRNIDIVLFNAGMINIFLLLLLS